MKVCGIQQELEGAILVVLPSKAETVRKQLPVGVDLLQLRLRSIPDSLAHWTPVRRDALVAVASAWPDFLTRARTMLIAAGFHPDGLLLRDSAASDWTTGLDQVSAVVCDSLTASKVPKSCRAIPFPLLAESSLAELRSYEQFISQSPS